MTRALPLVILSLCSLATAACGESASKDVFFTSVEAPVRSVVIKNDDGRVSLRAGPPGSRIEGRMAVVATGFDTVLLAQEALDDVALVESGSSAGMVLEVAAPELPGWPGYDVGLELVIPANVAVTILAGDDSVIVSDLEVDRVETRGGAVMLSHTAGNAVIAAHGGSVEVAVHEGDLAVETLGAPIELERIYGEVHATSHNAPIIADILPPPGGDIRLSTSNAPIDLILPSRFDASFVGVTTAPGLIEMNTIDFFPSPSAPGVLAGELGVGAGYVGSVELRTTGADISLKGR